MQGTLRRLAIDAAVILSAAAVALLIIYGLQGVRAWTAWTLGASALLASVVALARLSDTDAESAGASALIVGTGRLALATAEHLRFSGVRVAGFLSTQAEADSSALGAQCLGTHRQLARVLGSQPVDEVYLACHPARDWHALAAAVETCETLGMPFALPAFAYPLHRARPVHARAAADGYLHFRCAEPKPAQRALKRAIDVVVSAMALAVLSPLLIATAVLVKLTSPGPVLFRQVRVGQHGRLFKMLKFRSMVQNAEALRESLAARNELSGPVFKIRDDPRLTPIGRFLRKYSIDELPQLLNVLRGEMSLVGPRPPIPSEVGNYEAWQRRRLSVRPGLTCLWQVSGRNEVSFEQWMYLDLQYIDHWSVGRDLGLLLKTVPVVLSGKGAS